VIPGSRRTDERPSANRLAEKQSHGMRIATLLLLAPLLAACSEAKDVVDPKTPDVSADRVSLTKISPKGLELLIELGVQNPNSIDLEARSVTADVTLDGGQYDMGTVEIPQEVDLPSEQHIQVPVPVVVDWKDVTVVASLVALKRNIPYDIDGSVKIGVELFKVTVPFHVNDVITEEQMRQAVADIPPGDLR
jgi:LEA14-like dessication related protein